MCAHASLPWILPIVLIACGANMAGGQDYPAKSIRILTSPTGGGNDFVARILAQGLSAALGQSVIVDNRTGMISIESTSVAPADGYTLLVASSSFVTGHLLQKVPYDPIRDFVPITHVGNAANILVVHPSLPTKSVKELIELAKAKPGQLNYGSGDAGSAAHLSAELLKSMARIDIARVNYKGNGPSLVALIGGEIQLLFPTIPSASPHVKAGRMRALAVTGLETSVLTPNLPTMAASGLPGYKIESIYGLLAPSRTPTRILERLDQEIVRFLKSADAREKLLGIGIEPVTSTPQNYAALIKDDVARMSRVIKDAGIRVD